MSIPDGDEIFNMIADKIYAAALTYDRLIKAKSIL